MKTTKVELEARNKALLSSIQGIERDRDSYKSSWLEAIDREGRLRERTHDLEYMAEIYKMLLFAMSVVAVAPPLFSFIKLFFK